MKAVFGSLILAASAYAQLVTTTYTWAQGDTAIVSLYTDPLGNPTYSEVRVLTPTGTALTTPLTTALTSTSTRNTLLNPVTTSTSTTSTSTRTNTRLTQTTQTGPNTQTTQQRVGDDTALPPPMRTTTYWYDVGDGSPWSVATWTATFTGAPTVATAVVPQGNVQTYGEYQTSVNARVLASAVADQSEGAASLRASRPGWGGVVGLAAVGVGAVVGAGMVL